MQWEADDVLAVLPRELTQTVASRLTKFVLRAKVKITDESSGWRISGLVAPHSPPVHWGGATEAQRTDVAGLTAGSVKG